MNASRFSEAQKAFVLKQGEEGTPVDVCRRAGISQATYFSWKEREGRYCGTRGPGRSGSTVAGRGGEDHVSTLRDGREVEERHIAQEAEGQREMELEQEREVHARRDKGHDYWR